MAEHAPDYSAEKIAECVDRFRIARPHVHCITNSVAQHFTANVVLAAGGQASMTIAPDEIESFVAMADALLINLGTMDDDRRLASRKAVEAATWYNKPWSLDPVFVQASPPRLKFAQELLSHKPTVVRCNDAEFQALFREFATHNKITFVRTGKLDIVSQAARNISLVNGAEMMDRVTAMGCALNALMIGFAAVEADTMLAAISALSLYNIAGEIAESRSDGPGTFVPHFLDVLASLEPETLAKHVRFA